MFNAIKRYVLVKRLQRSMRVITRELTYYNFIVDESARCDAFDYVLLGQQRLDLLKYKHKLIDQYNAIKFNWMKGIG